MRSPTSTKTVRLEPESGKMFPPLGKSQRFCSIGGLHYWHLHSRNSVNASVGSRFQSVPVVTGLPAAEVEVNPVTAALVSIPDDAG